MQPSPIWKICLSLAVGALFLFGAWLRWTDGFIAITSPDSHIYLLGALTGDLNHVPWRTFVYPLFLKLTIGHLGGLEAVLALQKIFGLAAAGLTFAAWIHLKTIVRYTRLGGVIHDCFGLLLLAMMLLPYGSTRYYELSIMLESSSALALSAVAFIASRLFVALRGGVGPKRVAIWASAMIGISLFANTLNPRFGPCIILALLFAATALRLARASLRQSLLAFVVPIALAIPLLLLPQRALDKKNVWNRSFVPMHLFFVQAKLTLPEIAHDRDDPAFIHYDKAFLGELAKEIELVFALAERNGHGGNETLKFDPNLLLWGKAANLVREYFRNDATGAAEFYRHYFLQAVWNQPGAYLKKVATEWVYLLRPGGGVVDDSMPPLPLIQELSKSSAYASTYLQSARAEVRADFVAYQNQLADSKNYSSVVLLTPFPMNYFGNWVNWGFLRLGLLVSGLCIFFLWKKSGETGAVNLALVSLGSSLLLFSQLSPLALFTTMCGFRAIQGVRVLFAFTTVDLGLTCLFLLAHLVGLRRLIFLPTN